MKNTAIETIVLEDTTIAYERANKVSVKTIESGVGYQADFYRTHKHIASMISTETGWLADPEANKSANRESFRQFAIEHAADIQVNYDPEDRRSPRNTRVPTYSDDSIVEMDAANMLHNDIIRLLDESNPYDIRLDEITMESIIAKGTTSKGTPLSTLGIIDGKYLNGNWAWADIDMLATFTIPAAGGQNFQMLYKMELVSGQLKKNKLTKTSFADNIYEELLAMNLVEKRLSAEEKKALAKAEKSATPTPTNARLRTGKLTDNEKSQRAHFNAEIKENGMCALMGAVPNCGECTGDKCKWREMVEGE